MTLKGRGRARAASFRFRRRQNTDHTMSGKVMSGMSGTKAGKSGTSETIKSFMKSHPEGRRSIGVFTSGGDSCGMNPAVRATVRMGQFYGCRMFFIREGYQGLIDDGAKGNFIIEATWESVSGIIEKGGTVIGSARCEEFRHRAGRLKAAANLIKHGISNLVCIGGDGSLTGADLFRKEWPSLLSELVHAKKITEEERKRFSHLHIAGMVGSIDNDFCGTDMTIGADSALHRIQEAVDAIVTTAASHQRTFILEIMGRHCGYLTLVAAISSEADFMFIPESPPKAGWQQRMCDQLRATRDQGQRLNIILVAEGAIDQNKEKITSESIRKIIVDNLKHDTRVSVLGHVQRGGPPSAFDRILGCRMGAEGILALKDFWDKPESEASVASLVRNQDVRVNLIKSVAQTKSVASAVKEQKFDQAVSIRGETFQRNLAAYKALTEYSLPAIIDRKGGFRVLVVCIGNPAPGMNAVIRTFARVIFNKGGHVFACADGVDGLIHGSFEELEWSQTIGITARAGCRIATSSRSCDSKCLAKIAKQLEHNQIHAMVGIGGFDCFQSFSQMVSARNKFKGFRIPLSVIPATIYNNVPGADFSIGSDSALNEMTKVCDWLKKSQESAKHVIVCELTGDYCGYLATTAGLASGADAAFLAEDGISVKEMRSQLNHLIKNGNETSLILVDSNYENCKSFIKHAKKLHEVYVTTYDVSIMRGDVPSPFDRNIASQVGLRAGQKVMEILSKSGVSSQKFVYNFNQSEAAFVVGMIGSRVNVAPIQSFSGTIDAKNRCTKTHWYSKLSPLMSMLAAKPATSGSSISSRISRSLSGIIDCFTVKQ